LAVVREKVRGFSLAFWRCSPAARAEDWGDSCKPSRTKDWADLISSWISTGENLPINADQIREVLGNETISNLAAKAGISTDDLSAKLSEYLPGVIDKLTPDGSLPEGGLLEKGLDFLKGKLG